MGEPSHRSAASDGERGRRFDGRLLEWYLLKVRGAHRGESQQTALARDVQRRDRRAGAARRPASEEIVGQETGVGLERQRIDHDVLSVRGR